MEEHTKTEGADNSNKEGWQLAKTGIDLLLNNRTDEAERLFKTNTNNIQLAAGYSFLTFINALMSYEDDKLAIALNTLRETENKCSTDTGWLRTVKNKMLGVENRTQTLAESLEEQIILADTQVCLAILTFLQQEFSGYLKGGWVLRKAWKIYQHVYNEILNLYIKEFGILSENGTPLPHLPKSFSSSQSSAKTSTNSTNLKESSSTWSVQYTDNNLSSPRNSSTSSIDIDERIVYTENENSMPTKNGYISTNNYGNNINKIPRSASGTSLKFSRLTQSLSYPLGFISDIIHSTSTTFSPNNESNTSSQAISSEEISRLMAAVSFGYGVFQLSASLLPPTMLKLTQLFGFGADRRAGIESLMYARTGNDMRAPLATYVQSSKECFTTRKLKNIFETVKLFVLLNILKMVEDMVGIPQGATLYPLIFFQSYTYKGLALLWYHTIVRPFFALDGYNLQAGVEAANALMKEAQINYSQSALFLFFEGRIYRLESKITKALESYQLAVDNSNQREIKLLCLHEVGWCYLIKLEYAEANTTFMLLKQRSRWSRSFYAYLAVICAGACNILTEMNDIIELKDILSNSTQKNSQLDIYLNRRVKIFPENEVKLHQCNALYWKMFTYELLYLWNALPSCSSENLENILNDCHKTELVEPMMGLSDLIAGSCYSILGNLQSSIQSYRNCLQKYTNENCTNFSHIGAFAQYELATLLLKNSNTATEGKDLMSKIQSDYKDYDFEHRLNVRIHSVLRHL